MPTIKEIAALAGVSRGTVDRVLNKRGGVHPDTKARILEIAKALDYRPNKAGIVLSAQRKNLKLGVVMFGTNNLTISTQAGSTDLLISWIYKLTMNTPNQYQLASVLSILVFIVLVPFALYNFTHTKAFKDGEL